MVVKLNLSVFSSALWSGRVLLLPGAPSLLTLRKPCVSADGGPEQDSRRFGKLDLKAVGSAMPSKLQGGTWVPEGSQIVTQWTMRLDQGRSRRKQHSA